MQQHRNLLSYWCSLLSKIRTKCCFVSVEIRIDSVLRNVYQKPLTYFLDLSTSETLSDQAEIHWDNNTYLLFDSNFDCQKNRFL